MDNTQTKQFKTNIKCDGCIAKVTPYLNEVAGAGNWTVDTANKDKILTVSNGEVKDIEAAVQKAGYKIELSEQ